VLRPVLSLVACFLGVIGFPIAAMIIDGGNTRVGAVLAAVSVLAVAFSVWAARGNGGGGGDEGDADDDDGGGGEPGGPNGPLDWQAFDRQRAEWEHSSTR
jgi:hypothetical protein